MVESFTFFYEILSGRVTPENKSYSAPFRKVLHILFFDVENHWQRCQDRRTIDPIEKRSQNNYVTLCRKVVKSLGRSRTLENKKNVNFDVN